MGNIDWIMTACLVMLMVGTWVVGKIFYQYFPDYYSGYYESGWTAVVSTVWATLWVVLMNWHNASLDYSHYLKDQGWVLVGGVLFEGALVTFFLFSNKRFQLRLYDEVEKKRQRELAAATPQEGG